MAETEARYLRDKKIPELLESLAAELLESRPANLKLFLAEKFGARDDDASAQPAKLFWVPLEPASTIARLAVAATKLNVQLQEAFDEASLRAVSPFLHTPALEQDDISFAEVGPVTRYLVKDTPFYPTINKDRLKVDAAFEMILGGLLPVVSEAVNEKYFILRKNNRPPNNALVGQLANQFRELLKLLEKSHFFESTWVIGARCSLADIAFAGLVFSMQSVVRLDCIAGLKKIEKWWSAMQKESIFWSGVSELDSMANAINKY